MRLSPSLQRAWITYVPKYFYPPLPPLHVHFSAVELSARFAQFCFCSARSLYLPVITDISTRGLQRTFLKHSTEKGNLQRSLYPPPLRPPKAA